MHAIIYRLENEDPCVLLGRTTDAVIAELYSAVAPDSTPPAAPHTFWDIRCSLNRRFEYLAIEPVDGLPPDTTSAYVAVCSLFIHDCPLFAVGVSHDDALSQLREGLHLELEGTYNNASSQVNDNLWGIKGPFEPDTAPTLVDASIHDIRRLPDVEYACIYKCDVAQNP